MLVLIPESEINVTSIFGKYVKLCKSVDVHTVFDLRYKLSPLEGPLEEPDITCACEKSARWILVTWILSILEW